MTRAIDITGQRFGKLVAIEVVGRNPFGHLLWRLRCDCGGETTAQTGQLRAGKRKACACGLSKPKHGMHNSRIYRIWSAMKARCQNPKLLAYQTYGGRGITVCAEWQEFVPFMEWSQANGYADDLQIDRIDNDGPYSPDNCRWVTAKVNARNKRPPRPLGLRYTMRELRTACSRAGIDSGVLFAHLPKKRVYR